MPANGVARHFLSFVVLAATAASVQPAAGQGMLVDVRPESHWRLPRPILPQPPPPASSYRISSLEVNVRLKGAVAQVQVGQTFENTGSGQIEAALVFPLPYDGAIDALTLMVDGREYPAKLLDADEARKQYEQIVRTSRDPALLQWVGVGMFQTSVFPIPPGAKRTVTIRYSQLCRQSQGLTDFLFPLSTARYTSGPIEKLSLRVAIEGEAALKTVYSPTHAVNVERPDEKSAVVTVDVRDAIPAADFRLFAQAEAGDLAASVVSYRPDEKEDGYFLLLATPPIEQPEAQRLPKTVVFVVDRSGSMSGAKMEQAREALKFVLNNLRAGDTFNIVAYDSEVEAFRPELEKFDEQSRLAALGFVNGLFAGGTTNIDGALSRALGMIQDAGRPAYVLFLTDGIPTFGETSEARIARNAEAANQFGARIFTFGVGYDLNSRLLDKLARSGRGQTEFVRPEENVEAAVSSLYRRIGAPVMTDVTFSLVVEKRIVDGQEIVDGWDGVSRVYPRDRFDLFAGDQFVLAGRYQFGGPARVILRGKVGDEETTFEFPVKLAAPAGDDANAFVAKLWASRRVGEILDEIDLHGKHDELVKELVDLAARHGILTPYTSFLADDSDQPRDRAGAAVEAASRLSALDDAEGAFGFRQREAKAALRSTAAPASAGGGVGGGFVPAHAPPNAAASGPAVTYYDAETDQHRVAKNLIVVGRKTFFRRGGRWVDSTVTADEEREATAVERFSPEYFDLVARHGEYVAAYLAIDDPVTLKLDGRVYAW